MKGVYKTTEDGMRQCSQCGKIFPATNEFFHQTTLKNKKWTGLRPECKFCRLKKMREKRQNAIPKGESRQI